ncbi:unnamed protein product, partial [Discosporangium mesarthrocarpum]
MVQSCLLRHLYQSSSGLNFNTADYLNNRLPSSALRGKTPYSVWHGGKFAPLQHLRVIGERALVHENIIYRKLKDRSWKGRLVGYGEQSRTYRVRRPGTRTITSSRNDVFIEAPPTRILDSGHHMQGEEHSNKDTQLQDFMLNASSPLQSSPAGDHPAEAANSAEPSEPSISASTPSPNQLVDTPEVGEDSTSPPVTRPSREPRALARLRDYNR